MIRSKLVKLFTMAAALLLAGTALAEPSRTVLDGFLDPDARAKPMARMWFPDAGAGEDDGDRIGAQVSELADKGFGGVEIAMLMSFGVRYTNEEARTYGWGTDNWIRLLKKVLLAAAEVPGGFQVDMTVTSHWPPILNTIDPNDAAANKELSFSVTPITAADLENGFVRLALPAQKTDAPAVTFGFPAYSHFLFTDTFVSATVARIASVEVVPGADGAEDSVFYTFDFGSLVPVTDGVTVIPGAGYAAGIPDRETAEARGWDYDEICRFFGPDSEGPWTRNNGKQDDMLNRRRMADWQDEYQASLEGLEIAPAEASGCLEAGDWVVLSVFYRGTGQSISGGCIMHNGVFVTGYFSPEGTSAVTDFWDGMFERDPELLELMKANPGYFFEDSIEATSVSSYWSPAFMDDVDEGYAYRDILPAVAAGKYVSSGFMGETVTRYYAFTGDGGLAERVYEDYAAILAGLYVKYHVEGFAGWAERTAGWGFRGQTFHLPGLEIGSAAMAADVPEGDNNAKGDGIRYLAGVASITGRDYLSMEAMTGPAVGYANMGDVLTELGQNYSDGTGRVVLHGSPYTRSFNGYNSEWPGWLPFGAGSYGSSFTYREAYWQDFGTETGFMARVQAVLQNGVPRTDLAVLIDIGSSFDFESGNRFQELLDMGYSYHLISESVLLHSGASVSGGALAADGPAYKALIADRVGVISAAGTGRLAECARAGLPVVLVGGGASRVYGSDTGADSDVAAAFAELEYLPNVRTAGTAKEVPAALAELGVAPYAQYDAPRLEASMYRDPADGTCYYYLYNNANPGNSAMVGNSQGDLYKGEDKALRGVTVTLAGDGVPYRLDPYTGAVARVADYTAGDGAVTLTVDRIDGGTAVIYAVAADPDPFEAAAGGKTAVRVTEHEPVDLGGEEWRLVIHSYGPDADSGDPGVSRVTDVDFGALPLGKWSDIPATEAQLAALGVDDMRYVSGTGEYTLAFTAPAGWNGYDGAYIAFEYGRDQVGAVIVNGTELPANNASDRIDAGALITEGRNEITIRLNTTLYGRTYAEHSGYMDAGAVFGMGAGIMDPPVPGAYYNGLLGVRIIPYTAGDGGDGSR